MADYPSFPVAGVICRPDNREVPQLFQAWRLAVDTAPENVRVLLYAWNWQILLWPISGSMIFSFIYVFLLSKFARILVWAALTAVTTAFGLLVGMYAWNYHTGALQRYLGRALRQFRYESMPGEDLY